MTACSHLIGLLNYEIALGNVVARVEARLDSNIDCFVLMRDKLKIWGTPATGDIREPVSYWDLVTSDTMTEAGFRCPEHKCVVAGPGKID